MTQSEKYSKHNTEHSIGKCHDKITTVNIMKHGWHQTVNNSVCYYQTPSKIALILEQV